MEPFHEFVNEYKKQLGNGAIQKAYRGLIEYVMALRTHFQKKFPDFSDFDALRAQIERETLKFIGDIESFLSAH